MHAKIGSLMRRLAGRKLFTVGKRTYRGEDLVLCAHLWGEYATLEARARRGIACSKHMEAMGEDVPESAVDEAAEVWRYERDLLSADDTESWLAERQLKADEWLDYMLREALLARWSRELDRISKRYKVSAGDVGAALYAEAVCSGLLTKLNERLAAEAAVHDHEVAQVKGARPSWCSKTAVGKVLAALPPPVKRTGVVGLTPAATRERAEFLACVTLSHGRFVARTSDPTAVSHEIDAHALDWTRIDSETVTFASEEAAREAALLVREDGLTLHAAAAVAKARVRKTRYLIQDVAQPLKDRLVGASAGELLGPVSDRGGFLLVSVLKRTEPSGRDRAIRSRAADAVIGRTIQREVGRRVRWHERV